MHHDEPGNQLTFGQMLDNETHHQIRQLNEKLKTLLINIDAKKTTLSQMDDAQSNETKQQLILLQGDVQKALIGIEMLVNVVVTERANGNEFTPQEQEGLAELREMLLDNTRKMTDIEASFSL